MVSFEACPTCRQARGYFLIMCFIGCDTPYTGFLGPGDIDGYLESSGCRDCLPCGWIRFYLHQDDTGTPEVYK